MSEKCMKILIAVIVFISFFSGKAFSQDFVIRWKDAPGKGCIKVRNGNLLRLKTSEGRIDLNNFNLKGNSLQVFMADSHNDIGPNATVVTVELEKQKSFSFFLRDVQGEYPICIPNYGVAVLPIDDERDYSRVLHDVLIKKAFNKVDIINRGEEMSFEAAASLVRKMDVPIWLGIGRDMRIFELEDELETNNLECKMIRPRLSGTPVRIAESNNQDLFYRYALGRGVGVRNNVKRSLDEGILPIYHTIMQDDDILYKTTSFVSYGSTDLTLENLKGTDFYISDKYSPGRVFTEEQKEKLKEKEKSEDVQDDIILYSRTWIENSGNVPRYAWVKAPQVGNGNWKYFYDVKTGASAFSENRIFCISKINNQPMPNEEMAMLLLPGQKVCFEFRLSHTPISKEKASQLFSYSFDNKYDECKAFWHSKLEKAAKIRLPEPRIQNMISAGLLHLDLITYGKEPDGTLAANVGIYSPIGTESSSIIQFYLSMGWVDEAKRALMYFFETQQDNGLIANYSGYMVETGAVLWNVGEYFRYTNDTEWILKLMPKILKSCDYLMKWRDENKRKDLVGKGYGMIDGKVADPEDNFHQFMLNGYSYMGLKRIVEILDLLNKPEADKYNEELLQWRKDIKEALTTSLELSPVVPLGNGMWSPTAPPWTEAGSPRALCQTVGSFWSHGTFTIADGLLGPLYLVFCEVLDISDDVSKMLLDYHRELFYQGNSAFSQPYYSVHNWCQAKLGMVKPFLNTYYTTVAATADRQTYSFWEHLYKMTPHKTHEEANFLMDTRRMLYMENGDTLDVFKVIPRKWIQNGKEICMKNVNSYFGKLDIEMKSMLNDGIVNVDIECLDSKRLPSTVKVRIPHPEYQKAIKVEGGIYDPENETVIVNNFQGKALIRLYF